MQAGRLEVPVVADLSGFAQELKTKVETAAKKVSAKINAEVDTDLLREKLETAVETATAGVTAKIKVEIDRDQLRSTLEEAVQDAASSTMARIGARADDNGGGLLASLRRLIGDANNDPGNAVRVRTDVDGPSLMDRIRATLGSAQRTVNQAPLDVPMRMRLPRPRRMLRGMIMPLIISLAQPAGAALMQLGAGLTAMASAAAPAVGVVGALPGLIAAAGMAAIGTAVAFKGFGEALKQTVATQAQLRAGGKLTKAQQQKLAEAMGNVSKSAAKTIAAITGVTGAWSKMRKSVQERFFSQIHDQIKPLSKALLPQLKTALGDAADQMGGLAERGAKFMRSGVFKAEFGKITKTNSKVIGNLTDSIANLSRSALTFTAASGPFVERIGEATERWTRWLRASTQAGAESGAIERFLDRAGDKGRQLVNMTKDLGKGLAGMGRAATESGESLLKGMEDQLRRFNLWANSDQGQRRMKAFFDQSLPAYREMVGLIGDIGRGLAKIATDDGLVNIIRQLRTELLPGLGGFLDTLGRTLGPQVISLISGLAVTLQQLAATGGGIALIAEVFANVAFAVGELLRVVPGASTALAVLITVALGLKVFRGLTGIVSGLGSRIAQMGAFSASATRTMGPQISTVRRMGLAYQVAGQQASGFTGTMRGVRAAAGVGGRGVAGALSGLVGFLGGPWGAAIAVATIGLTMFADHQRKAAEAARQHKADIQTLAQALRDSEGAINSTVRAATIKMLQDNGLADSAKKAGVSLKELTDATLEQDGSLADLQKRMRAFAMDSYGYHDWTNQYKKSDAGKAADAFADDLERHKNLLGEAKDANREYGDAMAVTGTKGTDAYSRLKAAVRGLSDETKDADTSVQNLKDALDSLTGNTQQFHDAQTAVNRAVLDAKNLMKDGFNDGKGFKAKDLITDAGMVNTSTEAGQQLNSTLSDLRDRALAAAVSAKELADQTGKPLSSALKKGEGEMKKARDTAIDFAMAMGLNREQAEKLATEMQLLPSTVSLVLQAKGVEGVSAGVLTVHAALEGLPEGETVTIDAPPDDAIKALEDIGVAVQKTPDGKQITVEAPTGKARERLTDLATDLANIPSGKEISVKAVIKRAVKDLQTVQDKIAETKGKPFEMEALTATAERALETLGYKVTHMKDGKVKITIPTGGPRAAIADIQSYINNVKDGSALITITRRTIFESVQRGGGSNQAAKNAAELGLANGAVVDFFANGGLWKDRVRAFANGTERHVAQIARAGAWRVWAEPETGGEAYVPLAESKRDRSKAIVEEVVKRFGGAVAWFADGGFASSKAAALYDSARPYSTGAVRRTSPESASAAAPLVGGDLNVNVGSVGTTRDALGEAMFELRRIKLGGSSA
jgi:hypothetical protein